ncbi:MAG: hypothetical protein ACR2H6_13105 [Pyrinomonadaceae bacterium]
MTKGNSASKPKRMRSARNKDLLAAHTVRDDSGGLGEQQERQYAKRERVADGRRCRLAARELIGEECESNRRHAAAEQGDNLLRTNNGSRGCAREKWRRLLSANLSCWLQLT